MNYRLYRPGDFAQLYAVEEACFQPPLRFARSYMRQLIESPASATWIAEEENRLTGFGIVECSREEDTVIAYIQTIEVDAAHRRQGISSELMQRMEDSARYAGATMIWLHVDVENAAAIHLYCSRGYERRGRQEHYYARGRAADIYSKALVAPPNP